MARPIDEQNVDRLEQLVARHPAGVGRQKLEEEYAGTYGEEIPRRTLQYRLNRLIALGRIRSSGAGRAVRYFSAVVSEPEAGVLLEEDYVPLSPEGAELRALIRRPLMARTPVAYDPDFLLRYEPGRTWYLPPVVRTHLHERGRTPAEDRPAGTYARDVFSRLLIDLAWASSRLEGNTYTRLDTLNLLEFGQQAEGRDVAEAQMILNHKHAIELLVDQAEEAGLNLYTFRNLHALLSENLLHNQADEGRIRDRIVNITGTVFHPLAVPQHIEEFFRIILEKAEAIPDAFEQAFFLMVHVPYLQPFIDVNKRVSRLGANLPLIKANLCPLSFVDVPERAYIDGTLAVYELCRIELLRDVFVWAYERSCLQYKVIRQSLPEPDPFRLRYRNELVEVLATIVRGGKPPRESGIREIAQDLVPAADLDRFVELAFSELLNLHEGSIARYRLRPGEFRAWRVRWKAP
jgi:hypothetical protein